MSMAGLMTNRATAASLRDNTGLSSGSAYDASPPVTAQMNRDKAIEPQSGCGFESKLGHCWLSALCGERFPSIDLAHVDLAGSEQSPEQHGRGLCR